MKSLSIVLLTLLVGGCTVNKNTSTMHPFTGHEIGCGNFIVFKLSEDNTEYVSVAFNASEVEWEDFQGYSLEKAQIAKVERKKYRSPIHTTLCNDVMTDRPEQLLSDVAISGTLEILANDIEREKAKEDQGYRVTIILKDVFFENSSIDYLRIDNVYVGWLPG